MSEIEIGVTTRARYPFVRCKAKVIDWTTGNPIEVDSWRPGIDWRPKSAYYYYGEDENAPVADGEGFILLTPVAVCPMPGRYRDRVFYTRQWEGPDGKVFGKHGLLVTTVESFRVMLSGYRYWHELEETAVETAP
jgi:hypothetical protein